MNLRCVIALLVCPLLSAAAMSPSTSAAAEVERGVVIAGAVIHPGWIELLTGSLADPAPVVTAIDLDAAARSNRFAAEVEIEGEWVCARSMDDLIRCRRVTVSPRGSHAFVVEVSGGGSGVFRTLVLVHVVHQQVKQHGEARRQRTLVCHGVYELGDRSDAEMVVRGDRIIVSHARDGSAESIPLDP